jgi:D-alanyl-D-alanine carboxypeptidase (penicillin-binding protein 5/6)
MFASLKSRIRVEDLIRGLVVASGNDAAIVLAEGLAGTEDAFAARMNQQAIKLGLSDLHATNPWGRDDPNQKVTARDMALLTAHIIQAYPDHYRYFGEKDFMWNKIRQSNRNPLLLMDVGADGLTTGSIDESSGYGLVASAVQNDQRLILVVYGAKTAKERADEARKILQWGFHSFDRKNLFAEGEIIGTLSVYGGEPHDVKLQASTALYVLLQKGSQERLQGSITYRGPLIAPIKRGDTIAHLHITRAGQLILDQPLFAAEDIGLASLSHRAWDAALEFGQGLFYAHILKR